VAKLRDHKKKVGCLGVLLFLVALFFALPTRKIVFRKHYDVVSIKTASEYQDKSRMDRASANGVKGYPSPLLYQSNGSTCGPTSLTNVFRSYGEPSVTVDEVLKDTGKCSTGICFMGLTLDELSSVAEHHKGYRVTVLRDLTLATFRDHLTHLADPDRRYVINFDRGPLFGPEGGHHSPLGGFLPDDDLVLVLDVNASYAPWLVKTERLFAAMDTLDGSRKRGLLLIAK
jgi:hypothetical protein